MKYLSHLKELRNRILLSFLFLIICFIFFFYNASYVGEFLSKPLFAILEGTDRKRMIFTGLPEVFLSNLKISLFASFMITFPFIIIQFVLFISPAMYKKEKSFFFSNYFSYSAFIYIRSNFCLLFVNSDYLVFFRFF